MPTESLPGVYVGKFPCDGCDEIEVTLWLRRDERFILRQDYAATDTRAALRGFSLGRWQPAEEGHAIELAGKGPLRIFARSDEDTLDMRTASPLQHRLVRDGSQAFIEDSIRMQGNIRVAADGGIFTECLTGLSVPVSKGADYRRFRHQLRSASVSGGIVPVELIGRFVWADDGSPKILSIEEFVTIETDREC
jgi:hypothetical protein